MTIWIDQTGNTHDAVSHFARSTLRFRPSGEVECFRPASVTQGQVNGTSDANGLVNLSYVGINAGFDNVQVTATIASARTVSNVTVVSWTTPPGPSPGSPGPPPPSITAPSPADGATVTKPVPISATITPPAGQTIASWSVAYQDLDPSAPVTLASGTGAPPATLATFDPTLLPNDTYGITISATASGGGTQTLTTSVIVFGTLASGTGAPPATMRSGTRPR